MTYQALQKYLSENDVALVAVSKTKPSSAIMELYDQGQRIFGENRVQELAEKYDTLPKDIEWHMIGHLQKNKVKYIAHFVNLIHSVDNTKLLETIDRQAKKNHRIIDVLLQIKIAKEASKSGWSFDEMYKQVITGMFDTFENIRIRGVMGMATYTSDSIQVEGEFAFLKKCYDQLAKIITDPHFDTISMGMSGDYKIAIKNGANMVRIGSLIFGAR